MAGISFLGNIGSTGKSTGPHGHVYVRDLNTGKHIDPSTIRSALTGLRIGEQKVPAIIKNKEGQLVLNPASNVVVTSKFGPRTAPTAGASSFHQGEDWALPEGTPVYMEGAGKFTPLANQGGYGNLATFKTGDNKYEVGIGHMASLGKAAEFASNQTPTSNAQNTGSNIDSFVQAMMYGASLVQPKQKTLQQSMFEQMAASAIAPRRSLAQEMLEQYISSNPYQG